MKAIKYIDATAQAVLMAGGILMLLIPLVTKHDLPGSFFYLQLTIGLWQYLGSLLSSIVPSLSPSARKTHFFVSTLYLAFLTLCSAEADIFIYIWMIPSMSLSIFCFIVTIKSLREINVSGKGFLPHSSF